MDRRSFLLGLASTTAIVAAGVPAARSAPAWGAGIVTRSDVLAAQEAANLRLQDLLLYGMSFTREPGGERVDPFLVYSWEAEGLEALGLDYDRMAVIADKVSA
jgi:hypothetical protein